MACDLKRRRWPGAALLSLGFALAVPMFSQTKADGDLTSLSLEELTGVKVFSASRHLENSQEAPSAVTVLTAEDIRRYGWRTLSEALASVRGFYTAYDRNYTYLGAEGFLRPGDYNTRILLLLNGHRLNDNLYGAALLGKEFLLDLDLVERIEIVRGPSSSLYGTNAMLGVINVIMKAPPLSHGLNFEVAADTGSFFSRNGRVTTRFKAGEVAGLVSGGFYESAGMGRLYFPEFDSAATNFGIAENSDGERATSIFTDIRIRHWRLSALYGKRTKISPTASWGTAFNDPTSRWTGRRSLVDVGYQNQWDSRTDADLHAYVDTISYDAVSAMGAPGSAERYLNIDHDNSAWMGLEGTVGHQFKHVRLTAGAQGEDTFRIRLLNYNIPGEINLNDERSVWMTAVYADLEMHPQSWITVRAGGRVDHFAAFGTSASPRAAVILQAGPRTDLKYIYGRAFRAPNAFETYYTDHAIYESNLKLNPEMIQSHDVVMEHQFRPWLRATADGYYSEMFDLIDLALDNATGMLHYTNAGRNRSRGLEFELQAQRSSGLSARASYTLNESRDQITAARLCNSPMHLAKAGITVPVPRAGMLAAETLYTGAMKTYQQTRVNPAFRTNLTFSARPIAQHWELSAGIYNLFDRRWYAPAGPTETQAEIEQDGRTFRVKLLFRWRQEEGR